MITVPDGETPRKWRTLEIGLVASMLVHLLLALFYFKGEEILAKLHVPIAIPHPQATQEVVTTSSAITLEKRARPKPVPVPAQPKAQQPQPRSPQSPPNPATVAQEHQLEAPSLPEPSKQRNEISKQAPSAPPIPPKTQAERQVTDTPSAPPTHAPNTPAPESRIALEQRAKIQQRAARAQLPRNPSNPSQLSQEQIARIQSDLSRTIAQARSDTNPLRVPPQAATAPKHYGIQMLGVAGDLRGYQGICDPTREMWEANGFDYYYVSCNVQLANGNLERQPMPWPIHFRPNQDPFNGSMSQSQIQRMPVPGPDPGWRLPAGAQTTNEMRDYAHKHGVDI
jgi:outer membrane biosynthesis protein TonB